MTALEIWDAASVEDRRAWEARHASWTQREVYAHPAYVSLFTAQSDRVLAAFAQMRDGWVLYPFILRTIGDGLTDTVTAYGYAGPYQIGDVSAEEVSAFWRQFDDWAASQRVVSEFLRFSLFSERMLPHLGDRSADKLNVIRTLEPDAATIWADFDHKVRKNVNKARRSGLTVEIDAEGARLDEFYAIYKTTMDRRGALHDYYFPRTFFERIGRELAGQFVYVHVRHDEKVVSTELVLSSADTVYSYLGGTDEAAFDLRPNDLLKHELILWAKQAGKRWFVLGGGYGADDGVYHYKRAFAPTGSVPFHTGRRILDRAAYDRLASERVTEGRAKDPSWSLPTGYFPSYRAPLP